VARATDAGARVEIRQIPSLMLDVDTGEDLEALQDALAASTGGAAHTRGMLARLRPAVIQARAIGRLPEVRPGDDLAALIAGAEPGLGAGDVVVVAHKVVSKAEGRIRVLADIEPGTEARAFAERLHKDARQVQAVLDETAEIVRAERVLICRTRHGFVCANAGVDASNAPDGCVVLLPEDRTRAPAPSAQRCRIAPLS